MFEIRLVSSHAPPQRVTILTPLNDWVAIDGTYADGWWDFSLDETQLWNAPAYFKFVLDGRFWMDDPYIRIAPRAGEVYSFDETEVTFSMSTPTPAAPAAPAPNPGPAPMPLTAQVQMPVVPSPIDFPVPVSEGSVINRVVVLATPFLTIGAAWIAAVIAKHVPGVKFDQTQLVSFMIAIVAVCLAGAWKWLQGWQQHELLVAQGLAAPVKTKSGG